MSSDCLIAREIIDRLELTPHPEGATTGRHIAMLPRWRVSHRMARHGRMLLALRPQASTICCAMKPIRHGTASTRTRCGISTPADRSIFTCSMMRADYQPAVSAMRLRTKRPRSRPLCLQAAGSRLNVSQCLATLRFRSSAARSRQASSFPPLSWPMWRRLLRVFHLMRHY
jgi:hypothetical protein